MRLTIIPSDQIVIVNGVGRKFSFEMDNNYHAVQWMGDNGWIETIEGPNVILENPQDFETLIQQHAAILAQEEQNRLAAEAEYNSPANVIKREIEALERQITPRRYREAILSEDGQQWMEDMEAQIEAKRNELQNLE